MTVPPSDAPWIGWDWDVVHDADLNEMLPPLHFNGAPVNLTGCTIQLHIRPSWGHATPIAILATGTGEITINDGPLGLCTVFAAKTVVGAWPLGEWQFFLRVIDGPGKIAEVARGPFNIHPGNVTP